MTVTVIPGADGLTIGTSTQNTIDIEAGCTTSGTAADICANLSLGGYNDWFLPSRDKIYEIYTELHLYGVGGFGGNHYWSSSEYNATRAHLQVFTDGDQGNYNKGNSSSVRAVRAF